MKFKKLTLFYVGIILALTAIIARLLTFGFLYPLGLISVAVFGPMHTIFLFLFYKYFNELNKNEHRIGLVGIFIFPIIFHFQFDIQEFVGSSYVYEFYTGEFKSKYEYYAYYLSVLAALIYSINFVFWIQRIKNIFKLKKKR